MEKTHDEQSNMLGTIHSENESESRSVVFTLCDPMDYIVHGILQDRILEWVAFPCPGDLPNPGIEPRSPALQVDSLPAELQGKPKNTGVGRFSLLQRIFPTQESNWGLLSRFVISFLPRNKLLLISWLQSLII